MKNTLKLTSIISVCLSAVLCCACGQVSLKRISTYEYFNSQATWVYEANVGKEEETWLEIRRSMDAIEKSVSVSETDSAICRFNAAMAGEEVELDKTAYELLYIAQSVYEATEGAYNPAVGNLIDLWGFSPRFSSEYVPYYAYDRELPAEQLPDSKYVETFLQLTDFSEVELVERDGKYFAVKPNRSVTVGDETYTMQLNLGGIGKGYAVDAAEEIINSAGYCYGYFNLGGSSMYVLRNPNGAGNKIWDIGVVTPRTELYETDFMEVYECDISLSTSGDYMQYYSIGGKRYCHIINPHTGYPVNSEPQNADGSGIVCASVFGLSAAEGDATTTALMVMGKDKAAEYIRNNLSSYDALFVYYDGSSASYTLYTNMQESDYRLFANIRTVKL